MGKDIRLYAKFTLDFADHEKILPLTDAAFRCLIEATLWSRKQMSDGWLARRLAVAKWPLDVLQELSTNDDENPSLIESEKGWLIRDFAEHQDTKADIEARRERNRLAGQLGGLAKGKQGAKRGAKRPASKPPSENLAETETTSLDTYVSKERPRKRGSRLSNDWMPTQSVIDAMRSECPGIDLKAEHRKFIDHWTDKTGRDAVKVSWDGTWRNWIRRAAEHGARSPTNGNVSAFQRKTANNEAVFHSLADDQPPELMA